MIGIFTLEQMRDPAGEFHHLYATLQFALGIRQGFSMFTRDEPGKCGLFLQQQFPITEQHARPLWWRQFRPACAGR